MASESARRLSVAARSAAEMPVEVPSSRSTETVNAVPMASSFSSCRIMRGMLRRSKSFPSIATQMRPLVLFTMNAMLSSVALEAARIRSPSFSRSSSSLTTRNLPSAISLSASSMLAKPGVGSSSLRTQSPMEPIDIFLLVDLGVSVATAGLCILRALLPPLLGFPSPAPELAPIPATTKCRRAWPVGSAAARGMLDDACPAAFLRPTLAPGALGAEVRAECILLHDAIW
mmetsp:Transcript_53663/g.170650  ORF Transcript_53663/g.170650 Transcript_53663/m.170650 type:complete len:230 (-) Transcript_53663:109-798(-)